MTGLLIWGYIAEVMLSNKPRTKHIWAERGTNVYLTLIVVIPYVHLSLVILTEYISNLVVLIDLGVRFLHCLAVCRLVQHPTCLPVQQAGYDRDHARFREASLSVGCLVSLARFSIACVLNTSFRLGSITFLRFSSFIAFRGEYRTLPGRFALREWDTRINTICSFLTLLTLSGVVV